MLLANADGSRENIIFRHESGIKGLNTDPSWSASGDLIAIGAYELGKNTLSAILVLTPEGKLIKSLPLPMLVWSLAWLPDSSGLFFIGAEKSTGFRNQIWFQPYPAGEPFKISNDLSQYNSLSVTGTVSRSLPPSSANRPPSMWAILQRPWTTRSIGS